MFCQEDVKEIGCVLACGKVKGGNLDSDLGSSG